MTAFTFDDWGTPELDYAALELMGEMPDVFADFREALTDELGRKGKSTMLGGDNWPLIRARFLTIHEVRPDMTVGILVGDQVWTLTPTGGEAA